MRGALLLAAAVASAVPAAAKDDTPVLVESAAVKDKPAVTLDPAKAYILVRAAEQTSLYLMKVPTAEDQAAYAAFRAREFAEAMAKYQRKLANYERDLKAPRQPNVPIGERPVAPTEESFAITSIDLMSGVAIGPINRFAKVGGSTYLQEVTPGTYRVYGPIGYFGQAGMMGTCFCMGSVQFDAAPGVITDLGTIDEGQPPKSPKGDSSYPNTMEGGGFFAPAEPGAAVDPRLASQKIVTARFRPVGKMPNYFGLAITRIPAMPGVLRYDRDRIVDLTGTQ